jgi:hypothetical protein
MSKKIPYSKDPREAAKAASGAPSHRQRAIGRDARAARATPLRPVLGRDGRDDDGRECDGDHAGSARHGNLLGTSRNIRGKPQYRRDVSTIDRINDTFTGASVMRASRSSPRPTMVIVNISRDAL